MRSPVYEGQNALTHINARYQLSARSKQLCLCAHEPVEAAHLPQKGGGPDQRVNSNTCMNRKHGSHNPLTYNTSIHYSLTGYLH